MRGAPVRWRPGSRLCGALLDCSCVTLPRGSLDFYGDLDRRSSRQSGRGCAGVRGVCGYLVRRAFAGFPSHIWSEAALSPAQCSRAGRAPPAEWSKPARPAWGVSPFSPRCPGLTADLAPLQPCSRVNVQQHPARHSLSRPDSAERERAVACRVLNSLCAGRTACDYGPHPIARVETAVRVGCAVSETVRCAVTVVPVVCVVGLSP